MYETHKLSGKFSLEYLVHLFECLENFGSPQDHLKFSQNAIERVEVSYRASEEKFYIKILIPVSEAQLASIMKTHSLKRVKGTNKAIDNQTLSSDFFVNVARAMMFGSNTILDANEEFELDFKSAKRVFAKSEIGSQIEYPPLLNIALIVVWIGYEFVKFIFFNDSLHFDIRNVDLIEGFLFAINCFFFWGLKPNKKRTLAGFDDIPVFREGTTDSFILNKTATRGAINVMIILMIVSVFTS